MKFQISRLISYIREFVLLCKFCVSRVRVKKVIVSRICQVKLCLLLTRVSDIDVKIGTKAIQRDSFFDSWIKVSKIS